VVKNEKCSPVGSTNDRFESEREKEQVRQLVESAFDNVKLTSR
jgi:hypothetical protein